MKKYFAFIALLAVIVFTFTSTDHKKQDDTSDYPLFEVKCQSLTIPHFRLSSEASPSEDQISKLCTCIWENFEPWEKETSTKLSQGKHNEISAVHMAGFPVIFGKRISECGGEKL